MSDTVILRRVFALDSNTGLTLSANQVLVTTSNAATTWVNVLSSLSMAGGPVIGNLPSTINTLSTVGYSNTSTFTFYFSTVDFQICTLSTLVDGFVAGGVTPIQLTSTVNGLGSSDYISSSQLISTTDGILSTLTSNYGFISSATLDSTIAGLGTYGYVSTLTLDSTIAGLGSAGFVSSSQLESSIGSLGSLGYISSASLASSITSLGTAGFISSPSLVSTVNGLGSAGYVSSTQLASTTTSLTNFISNVSTSKANIQFDTTGIVNVYGSNIITFCNVSNVVYLSTLFFSSLAVNGGNNTSSIDARITNTHVLDFSSISFNLSSFSSYMISSSLITLDFYPTIAFTKLATGATEPAMIQMSSFLQIGSDLLPETTVNNYFLASQTVFVQGYPGGPLLYRDACNVFASPIKMTFPASSLMGHTDSTLTLMHLLPSSLNNGGFQNALHGCNVTPYFGNPGGLFVSVQNIPK